MDYQEEVRRAIEALRARADLTTYQQTCRWLVAQKPVLHETVAIIVPRDTADMGWVPVEVNTADWTCECGGSRLLVPHRHRPFVPAEPMWLPRGRTAFLIPHGGATASALVELHWSSGVAGRGRLSYVHDPCKTEGDSVLPVAEVREQFVTVEGVTGFPLVATIGDLEVPLGMVTELSDKGIRVIPDTAMHLYVPETDGPLRDLCACATPFTT